MIWSALAEDLRTFLLAHQGSGVDWVFHTEFETKDKKKVKVREVLTATSPSSFIATFYRSENDGPMKLDWTAKHSKTEVR